MKLNNRRKSSNITDERTPSVVRRLSDSRKSPVLKRPSWGDSKKIAGGSHATSAKAIDKAVARSAVSTIMKSKRKK